MRTVSSRLAFVLVAVAALVAVGVAGGASKAGPTFVIAGASDPTYLDPALVSDGESFRATEQIFESLVSLKPGTTLIRPGLATKWGSRNGKDWTFNLRHGVKFHDNTPFNAAGVCANFNRQYNFRGPFQDASATYYWQTVFLGFHHNDSSNLSPSLYRSCSTKGKYTATLHLRTKSASFLPALVISSFAIQSPTAMKKYGANQGELRSGTFYPTGTYAFSHPTGTGPFKFKSWVIGQKVELVRNNSYWGPKPKIARVIIQPISNNTARVQALQSGEVNGADLIQPTDVPTIKKNKNLKLLNRPSFNVAYVTINSSHAPFNKLAVRQAVAYGLDRSGVVKSFYAGRAQVAQEFMPPQLFGWTNKVPWRPDYVKHVNDGTAGDLNLIGWTGDFGDPDNFVGTFFKTYSPQFGFHNAKIFNILAQAAAETNLAKRIALYQKANIMIMKFLPGVPYAHSRPALGFQKKVKGYTASPVGTDPFAGVYFGGQ